VANSLLDPNVTDLRDIVAILDDENLTGDERTDALAIVDAFIADGLVSDTDGFRDYADNEPTLIADSYFTEYARELADDLGLIPDNGENRWPAYCIDWEYAARELQYDYSAVDIDGARYWIRSY